MSGEGVPASYDTYAKALEDPSYTEWLRQRSEPAWSQASEHRFVDELANDAIGEDVYARYLVQDHAFVTTLVSLVGSAIAQAPSIEQARPYVTFLDAVTSEENDYFERAFEELDVPAQERESPWISPVTEAFIGLLDTAADEGGYAETLGVLVPVEWLYLDWATRVADEPPETWYLSEWVQLHANDDFEAFVGWMRDELDRIGPQLGPARQERVETLFADAVELEVAFFEQCYEA